MKTAKQKRWERLKDTVKKLYEDNNITGFGITRSGGISLRAWFDKDIETFHEDEEQALKKRISSLRNSNFELFIIEDRRDLERVKHRAMIQLENGNYARYLKDGSCDNWFNWFTLRNAKIKQEK